MEKGLSKCNLVKDLEEWVAILGCVGSSRDIIVRNLRRRKQRCKRPERGEEKRPWKLGTMWRCCRFKNYFLKQQKDEVCIFSHLGEILAGWLPRRQVGPNSCSCLPPLTVPCALRPLETYQENKSERPVMCSCCHKTSFQLRTHAEHLLEQTDRLDVLGGLAHCSLQQPWR